MVVVLGTYFDRFETEEHVELHKVNLETAAEEEAFISSFLLVNIVSFFPLGGGGLCRKKWGWFN